MANPKWGQPAFQKFGWGESTTMKYKQPMANTEPRGEDRTITNANAKKEDGRPAITMRGTGAATRGKKCTGPMA